MLSRNVSDCSGCKGTVVGADVGALMNGSTFDLSWWQRGLALTLFMGGVGAAGSGHLSAQVAGQPYALLDTPN